MTVDSVAQLPPPTTTAATGRHRRHNAKHLCVVAVVAAASVMLMLHASGSGPVGASYLAVAEPRSIATDDEGVAVGAATGALKSRDPSDLHVPAAGDDASQGGTLLRTSSHGDETSWTGMWDRRYMTQPDATLFTRDEGVRALLSAAQSTAQLVGCESLSVSSFLVASQLMEPHADLCYVQRLFQPCTHHPLRNGAHRHLNACGATTNATMDGGHAMLVPVLTMRLDTRRHNDHSHRRAKGGISKDPFVQDWIEDVIGPMEFAVVSELRIRRGSGSSGGEKKSGAASPVLYHRVASGFTVYDRATHSYVAFLPIALDRDDFRAVAAAAGGDNNAVVVELSLNIKLQREAFWGVNEVFHKSMGRTNLYVVGKGTTVNIPSSVWDRWWGQLRTSPRDDGDGVRSAGCLVGLRPGALDTFVGWWYLPTGGGALAGPTDRMGNEKRLASLKGFPLVFGTTRGRGDITPPTSDVAAPSLAAAPPSVWMVTGDSQSRSLYWAVRDAVHRGTSPQGALSERITAVSSLRQQKLRTADDVVPSTAATASGSGGGSVHIRYRWDNYLANLTDTIEDVVAFRGVETQHVAVATPVVVVVGMGAHPASWGQYTLLQFATQMKRVVAILRDAQHRHPTLKVVWYGAPAWPKPKPVDNFRITNSRLGLFNYLALEALLRQGATTATTPSTLRFCHLDFYGMTLPVLKWSKDGSHYDKSMVMPTAAYKILSVLLR